ncbi:putative GST-like protein YibF [BD1-7 clade bacterium]|uniref:Putative GST-like protein YibF n=1 Tax=BD1-7 clade bacterium TaxID=2029982 RepID=A0A5S9QSU2_9GAMM|nr:putative GST-like protein YibF [BD1-7 clade bacterium]CAA0122624.1 putative GST-like protein YibF [BD1-7 clade bacterium]
MNKIYGVPLSPYVRKVLFTLEHKNINYTLQPVLPFRCNEDYSRLHPLKKVPCFEDEYITLPDSSIICGYLDHKYPQSSVYPSDFREAAKARWLEEYADTAVAEVMLAYQFERIVKPTLRKVTDEDKVTHARVHQAPAVCRYLEDQLRASGYLFADGLLLCDIAVAGMFLTGRYGGFVVCAHTYPKLEAYLDRVWRSEAMQLRIAQEKPILENIYKHFSTTREWACDMTT